MDLQQETIQSILHYYMRLRTKYNTELASAPPGTLLRWTNHGHRQWIHAQSLKGNYIRRGINEKPALQQALARKQFLKALLAAVDHNIHVLTKASADLEPIATETILSLLPDKYQDLPRHYFYEPLLPCRDAVLSPDLTDRFLQHQAWASAPYLQSSFHREQRRVPTSRGLKVRSKSEALIVERLYSYEIPFRYEQVIPVGDKEFSADFTFEAADQSLIYWEHAGMMDSPSYVSSHRYKLQMYESVGIVPWDNLILTYDHDGVLDLPKIDRLIQYDLLPRL